MTDTSLVLSVRHSPVALALIEELSTGKVGVRAGGVLRVIRITGLRVNYPALELVKNVAPVVETDHFSMLLVAAKLDHPVLNQSG
ncbi:hypothetical protein [Citrobacter freundii]|uniref:hypothetical protein n=1 Tax=Citrobacter freundii TaxID=546 RepID=UPI0024B26813|nr:hypothetical protein [Citrobacter freundii]WHN00519.1 hypothetical protein QKW62_27030 [Citrobacter freundii]